jgi:glycosyltransferase involved in cell wall biosynthesis
MNTSLAPVVHQLIDCFRPTDAMGQSAIVFQRMLRHLGRSGEIFAREVDPRWHGAVRPMADFNVRPGDGVLYHHGIASPLVNLVLQLRCSTGVVYHNITPSHFYQGTSLERPLQAGRVQLRALARAVEVAIGVSDYNCAELSEAGAAHVKLVRLPVEPERFALEKADLAARRRFESLGRPLVLTVGRVVAHKRVDDVLEVVAQLQRMMPQAHALVVGALDAGSASAKQLRRRMGSVKAVTHLTHVSHAELIAAYHAADVYLSMSEHEGIGMPLLEASAAQLPVLAFEAGAVAETLGGHGLTFDVKNHQAIAAVAKLVCEADELKQSMREGQLENLKRFDLAESTQQLKQALRGFAERPLRRLPKPTSRPRVCVVVQRFGEHITGGAEAHARAVALRLAASCQVEVWTSCAEDHLTWANVFAAGQSSDGPLTVRRFLSRKARDMRAFNQYSKRLFGSAQSLTDETLWIAAQGPLLDGFERALCTESNRFDAFVFFTYLYAPTVWGLPLVADKALLVPTAHDEPAFAFDAFSDALTTPRALLCNTPEEQALIQRRFPHASRSEVVGVGVEPLVVEPAHFRGSFGIEGDYLLYVGRREAGKGLTLLLECFAAARRATTSSLTLVLAGTGDMTVSQPGVRVLGRIDEHTKWSALKGALAVVVPSAYESLSLLMLEAFAVGTPVLGNSASPVVVGQLQRSKGGLPFEGPQTFVKALQLLQQNREQLSQQAFAFAQRFGWSTVMRRYLQEIERLRQPRP